jgi:hypothetical protein
LDIGGRRRGALDMGKLMEGFDIGAMNIEKALEGFDVEAMEDEGILEGEKRKKKGKKRVSKN